MPGAEPSRKPGPDAPASGAGVFISSTCTDVEEYRDRAVKAAVAAGLVPVLNENWEASGARTPLAECLARVATCGGLVAIVAHRYGWKPTGGRGKSITRLECEEAARLGLEILAFIVDDDHSWPKHLKDSHRAEELKQHGKAGKALRAKWDATSSA